MKQTGVAILMGVIAAVSLTGCASKATDSTTAVQTETTKIVETKAAQAAKGGGNLVIYSPNSEGLMNATIPLFEEKYGVNVEVIQVYPRDP